MEMTFQLDKVLTIPVFQTSCVNSKTIAFVVTAMILTSCVSSHSRLNGLPKSDDDLLVAISDSVKPGHPAVCDVQKVSTKLGISIKSLSVKSSDLGTNRESLSEESSSIFSSDSIDAVLFGAYYRFASSEDCYCQIGLKLKPDRLCQPSNVFENTFGQKYQLSSPSPHDPQSSSRMFTVEANGHLTTVSPGGYQSTCANGFSILCKGLWR
jgi:hypothetical protein